MTTVQWLLIAYFTLRTVSVPPDRIYKEWAQDPYEKRLANRIVSTLVCVSVLGWAGAWQ
jgi:hypothetical protein